MYELYTLVAYARPSAQGGVEAGAALAPPGLRPFPRPRQRAQRGAPGISAAGTRAQSAQPAASPSAYLQAPVRRRDYCHSQRVKPVGSGEPVRCPLLARVRRPHRGPMLQHLGSHNFAEGGIDAATLDSTACTVLLCFRRVLVVLRLKAGGGLEVRASARAPAPPPGALTSAWLYTAGNWPHTAPGLAVRRSSVHIAAGP